jgi:hypothetical protein
LVLNVFLNRLGGAKKTNITSQSSSNREGQGGYKSNFESGDTRKTFAENTYHSGHNFVSVGIGESFDESL